MLINCIVEIFRKVFNEKECDPKLNGFFFVPTEVMYFVLFFLS